MSKKPVALIILDGFGFLKEKKYNAIAQAQKPNLDTWLSKYPHALLQASGKAVGLPEGYIGNSEVGHLTIGAGRIIKQPLTRINEAIKNDSFFSSQALKKSFEALKKTNGTLHLMGLLSDAGVHSHIEHLFALLDAAQQNEVKKIIVHAFLDGRDTPPKSAQKFLELLEQKLKQVPQAQLGTMQGRFYAMDRDKNWQRTQKSYTALAEKLAQQESNWRKIISQEYDKNITDEFITPVQLTSDAIIKNGDGIIFYNFRPDRGRQLTQAFIDSTFSQFPKKPLELAFFLTPVSYNGYPKTTIFEIEKTEHTLKDVLEEHNKSFFAIAETEKYAHVTYFFSGGKEEKGKTETRVLISSIPAKNYVDNPCMSAKEITQSVLMSLQSNPADFYLINYANADMVGHSGDFNATVKAIECLDGELKKLYNQLIEKMDGTMYITADHGNAEDMFDEKTGQPKTAHTTNLVPFLMIQQKLKSKTIPLPLHELSDIAPFILENMGLKVPSEMK